MNLNSRKKYEAQSRRQDLSVNPESRVIYFSDASEDSPPDQSNPWRSALEPWVLRIADSDLTWYGLNWLRPAKARHIGPVYILMSSILLGLAGMAVGVSMIYLALGHIELRVLFGLWTLVMLVEVSLHLLFAYFWNRRAETLSSDSASA